MRRQKVGYFRSYQLYKVRCWDGEGSELTKGASQKERLALTSSAIADLEEETLATNETRTFYLQPLRGDREPDCFINNKIQTHLTRSYLYSCKLEILALTNYRAKESLKP